MAGINFSGIASGIDGNSIIQATLDAKAIQKVPFQNKLNDNEAETQAYDKLRALLTNLDSKASIFQTLTGTAVTKSITSSDETIASAAVSGNANSGTISMTVKQIASSGRVTFNSEFSSPDAKIASGLQGTADININIGKNSSLKNFKVTIDANTTINELVTKLNSVSEDKYSATLVNVGTSQTPKLKLMISTLETGEEKGSIDINVDQSILDQAVFDSRINSLAQDSIVDVAGIGLVQRSSNTINDLIPGVSVELKQSSNTPVILKISNDIDKTTQKVEEFVSAYNELRKYISDNNKITRVENERGVGNAYGSLAKSKVDDELGAALRDALRSVKVGSGEDNISILSDLGIKTNKDTGMLDFDQAVFKKTALQDPVTTGRILSGLGDKISTTNGVIYNFTKYQGVLDTAEKSNTDQNDFLNARIERIDANIAQQKEYLTKLFATLEEKIGKLQSNATALTGIISQQSGKK